MKPSVISGSYARGSDIITHDSAFWVRTNDTEWTTVQRVFAFSQSVDEGLIDAEAFCYSLSHIFCGVAGVCFNDRSQGTDEMRPTWRGQLGKRQSPMDRSSAPPYIVNARYGMVNEIRTRTYMSTSVSLAGVNRT